MDVEKIKKLRLEPSPVPESEPRRRRYWLAVAAVALLVGIVMAGISLRDEPPKPGISSSPTNAALPLASDQRTESAGDPPPERPSSTTTSPPGTFVAAGYIEPIPPFPSKVTPLVAGRIEVFDLLEGAVVKKGEIIARLDASAVELEAREMERTVEANAARVAHARAVAERTRGLAEIGSISRSEATQAQAELAILEAEGRRLEATLATLRWRSENTAIRAPVDGVLYERLAQTGQWVGPGHESAIATIYDPARLQVWVDVNQREAHRLQPGQRVEITADAVPGRSFLGRVARILPRASLAKNTIQAKIELEEPSPALRPDLSVRVVFLDAEKSATSATPTRTRP